MFGGGGCVSVFAILALVLLLLLFGELHLVVGEAWRSGVFSARSQGRAISGTLPSTKGWPSPHKSLAEASYFHDAVNGRAALSSTSGCQLFRDPNAS